MIGIAKHSETMEKMVVYSALYGKKDLWVRPLKMFQGEIKGNGKKVKRFVFVSSGGAIYENAGVIPTSEKYPASPSSLYALANLIIEKYIEIYCKNYNLDFTIARLSNVYGPGQWESGIIPSIIIKILKNESPVIYGTGKQTRDFIYIDDAVEALIMLAEKSKNGIYNIGTGKEISLNKVFETTHE